MHGSLGSPRIRAIPNSDGGGVSVALIAIPMAPLYHHLPIRKPIRNPKKLCQSNSVRSRMEQNQLVREGGGVLRGC